MTVEVRRAHRADADAIEAFTAETWPDRSVDDYLSEVFAEWVETDDSHQRTVVAELDGDVVGVCQGVLLTDHEAWAQGMRVAPTARGEGIGEALTRALFDWAAARSATVMRNLVFSWNGAGLGLSRAAGFDPTTEFRWAHPEPDADAGPSLAVVEESNAAWSCWRRSRASRRLHGLGLAIDESWAVVEGSRDLLARADDETRVLALRGDGTRAVSYRTQTYEREGDDGDRKQWAEYGASAWTDAEACRALLDAVAVDAARIGADRTRVLVPETVRHVSDAALVLVDLSEHTAFVLEADLT